MPEREPTIVFDARKLADFGIGSYVRGLVGALTALDRDHLYQLLVPPGMGGALGVLPESFSTVEVDVPGYSLREQLHLGRVLERLEPDLYHAAHYVLPRRLPCPTVVTIHDTIHLLFPEQLPHRLARLWARYLMGRSVRRADRVLTVSQNSRRDLVRTFPAVAGRIEVVPNGIDPRFSEPLRRSTIEGRAAALGLDGPWVLFVGNPKPHKNVERLLRAWARALLATAADENLVLVGDRDGASEELADLADDLGILERVRFLGHVPFDDLRVLYQGATLFAFPSLYEGFGLPVVEAMASGTPVLASNTSALAEIAGGACEPVDPTDERSIAAALVRLLTDESLRRHLVSEGRARARLYNWESAARATLDVYDDILARRSG